MHVHKLLANGIFLLKAHARLLQLVYTHADIPYVGKVHYKCLLIFPLMVGQTHNTVCGKV